MHTKAALEKAHTYLIGQLEARRTPLEGARRRLPGPAVTISRQTGCGAQEVADLLAANLQDRGPTGPCAWTVFDRQLVEKVLEDHNLPAKLAKYIPEDRRSFLQDVTEELLGLRPPSWKIVPQTVETILHLVEMGHVIIVGRGASLITARTPNVFHVRLIAPLAQRIERVQQVHKLTAQEAAEFVAKEDRGRARFIKAHFKARADDDLLYHLVINTGRLSCSDAAWLIAEGARQHFERETERLRQGQPVEA